MCKVILPKHVLCGLQFPHHVHIFLPIWYQNTLVHRYSLQYNYVHSFHKGLPIECNSNACFSRCSFHFCQSSSLVLTDMQNAHMDTVSLCTNYVIDRGTALQRRMKTSYSVVRYINVGHLSRGCLLSKHILCCYGCWSPCSIL